MLEIALSQVFSFWTKFSSNIIFNNVEWINNIQLYVSIFCKYSYVNKMFHYLLCCLHLKVTWRIVPHENMTWQRSKHTYLLRSHVIQYSSSVWWTILSLKACPIGILKIAWILRSVFCDNTNALLVSSFECFECVLFVSALYFT